MYFKFNFRTQIFKISEKIWFYNYSKNLKEFLIKIKAFLTSNENFYLSESNNWISTRGLYMGILGNFVDQKTYFPNKKNFIDFVKLIKTLEYIFWEKRCCWKNYPNPLEFIKKNFVKTYYDFSNFYSTPILHQKDLIWNNFIRFIFIKNSLNYNKTKPDKFVIGFTVLTDTIWILEGQYEKIKKRQTHEKNIFFFSRIYLSFFSNIRYSSKWFFIPNFIFGKRETSKILRKEKIKNIFNYLRILTQKKNFPFICKISNHYIALLIINISLIIKSYVDYACISIQKREIK